MLRVGLWAHQFSGPEAQTGLGRYANEIAAGLSALPPASVPIEYTMVSAGAAPPERAPGVAWQPLWPPRHVVHLLWTWPGWPTLERLGGRFDLVHSLYPVFPLRSRAPLVASVHDIFPIDHPEYSRWFDRHAMRLALHRTRDEARRVITCSEWSASRLRDALGVEPDRLTVVPLGVADRFFHPRSSASCIASGPARPYAIAVGVVSARKNHVTAVRAIAELPAMELLVVGRAGDASSTVREVAEELGVAHRVRVVEPVTDEQLVDLVAGAAVLLHPSRDEGFGLPPLEAMALGTPAVVADAGALPEVVGDAGVVVEADDHASWAGAIERLVSDPEHRAELVSRGRRRAQQFTWAATAERTRAVHVEIAQTLP